MAKVHDAFAVHMLNDQGKQRAGKLAESFTELLDLVTSFAKPGRELSIVTTKLEEASFFAKRAMAINPENQQ